MSRILMADDHPMIRTAIEVLLRGSQHDLVGVAGTTEEAAAKIEQLAPDILLLDLVMPAENGIDLARRLRRDKKELRIVILTAAIDDAALMEARALGVSGLVLKSSDPAFIIECLDKVAQGGNWIDPELAGRIEDLTENFVETRRPALAPRERQLVRFVRQGLRNRQIAESLGVTEGTVKVYLHNIFEKLGVRSRTELAVRADEFLAESYSGR